MNQDEKYINPFTDFGFKRLFGSEPNKDLLIDFLNQLLPDHHKIESLTYGDKEKIGLNEIDRKAIFDIYCANNKGEKFIVEYEQNNPKANRVRLDKPVFLNGATW